MGRPHKPLPSLPRCTRCLVPTALRHSRTLSEPPPVSPLVLLSPQPTASHFCAVPRLEGPWALPSGTGLPSEAGVTAGRGSWRTPTALRPVFLTLKGSCSRGLAGPLRSHHRRAYLLDWLSPGLRLLPGSEQFTKMLSSCAVSLPHCLPGGLSVFLPLLPPSPLPLLNEQILDADCMDALSKYSRADTVSEVPITAPI